MDNRSIKSVNYYDRTLYNCFINSAKKPAGDTKNRIFTTYDIFSTVLSAMGFNIPNDKLGADMLSGKATLPEQFGYDGFDDEVQKSSKYYLKMFSDKKRKTLDFFVNLRYN